MKSTVEEKFVPKPADVVEQQSIMSLLQQQKVLQVCIVTVSLPLFDTYLKAFYFTFSQ